MIVRSGSLCIPGKLPDLRAPQPVTNEFAQKRRVERRRPPEPEEAWQAATTTIATASHARGRPMIKRRCKSIVVAVLPTTMNEPFGRHQDALNSATAQVPGGPEATARHPPSC
jgi:hypothetical protein